MYGARRDARRNIADLGRNDGRKAEQERDKRGVPVGDSANRVVKREKSGPSGRTGRLNESNRGYVVSQQQPVAVPKRPPSK